MHPELATAEAPPLAASTFGRLSAHRAARRPEVLRSFRERAVRVIGHELGGLPATTWLAVDVALVAVAVYVAYGVFPPAVLSDVAHIALWQAGAIFAFVVSVASLVFGLYERETLMSRSRIVTRMVLTTAAAVVCAYAIIHVLMYSTVGRRLVVLAMGLYLSAGTGIRLFAWWALHRMRRGLLVVGSRALFQSIERTCARGDLPEYVLAGFAAAGRPVADRPADPSFRGNIADLVDQVPQRGITDIVVGAGAAHDPNVMDWVVPCLQHGCRVTNEAIFYEKATGQILVDEITPHWFLFADLKVHCDRQATLKRAFDLLASVTLFCATAPLWALIALAVKLCDGGPVFYSQDRVGQNGRIFRLYKFRTMRTDAENGRSVWSSPNDPRVTPVGRVLRKTRFDELPQLYNVLIGQMSLIGPRPERPDIVQELCRRVPYYAERHLVKPGITGWAQISFHYGSSIEDAKRKLQFDLYYLKHMSFELDMIILFRTLGTFLRGAC